jgi:ketosteroid isomerase-like protein
MDVGVADRSVGERFLAAYSRRDWPALAALMTADVTWELPGEGRIAGRAEGVDAVLNRIRLIVGGGTTTELLHVLVGQRNIALSLHNTGQKPDGRVLDEFLVTLLRLDGDRIAAIETYLSDVPMMETFFGDAEPA